MSAVDLYDNLAEAYDLLISWKQRLKREKPFFVKIFKQYGVKRILDTACGTGIHAVAFHDWGFHVTATDISGKMIEKSIENADGRDIDFIQAGFDESDKIGRMFDAVTCIGNSLPHIISDSELMTSLKSMYESVLPGGIIIIHNNNYDRIVSQKDRFMPLARGRRDGKDFLFLRFFDFLDDNTLKFNVITIAQSSNKWIMHPDSSTHRALKHDFLVDALLKTGFIEPVIYGGYPDHPFDYLTSDNLIIIAQKPHTFVSSPIPEPISAINRIPIYENNEDVLDISVEAPEILLREKSMFARETVIKMLKKAQLLLPEGHKLLIKTACRSMEYQKKMYWEFYKSISDQHLEWPVSQIRREVNKFLAPPDAKHPPGHTTGGAIDVTIVDADGNELDMSSLIDNDINPMKNIVTYTRNITPIAAKNRQLLIDVMSEVKFSNYPGEWWHWSYGDSAWAVRVNADHALYGAVECCLANESLVSETI